MSLKISKTLELAILVHSYVSSIFVSLRAPIPMSPWFSLLFVYANSFVLFFTSCSYPAFLFVPAYFCCWWHASSFIGASFKHFLFLRSFQIRLYMSPILEFLFGIRSFVLHEMTVNVLVATCIHHNYITFKLHKYEGLLPLSAHCLVYQHWHRSWKVSKSFRILRSFLAPHMSQSKSYVIPDLLLLNCPHRVVDDKSPFWLR